jgi:hypothetical protein
MSNTIEQQHFPLSCLCLVLPTTVLVSVSFSISVNLVFAVHFSVCDFLLLLYCIFVSSDRRVGGCWSFLVYGWVVVSGSRRFGL